MNARSAAEQLAPKLAAAGVPDARFEAELLAREAASIDRAKYFAGSELSRESTTRLDAWGARRVQREPAPYITGHREFFGREFVVGRGVLVPRPETELLVEIALAELDADPAAIIAEAGTGSGAVAVSIAAERPGARVVATEISPVAMRFAHANALAHAPAIALAFAYLLSPLVRADIVVANLPYIPTKEIDSLEPEISRWEPRVALDGGADGLALIRRLIADCDTRLRPRLLALEVGFGQAEAVAAIFDQRGRTAIVVKDLAGIDRIVCARWR